jgi:hypothetical protein
MQWRVAIVVSTLIGAGTTVTAQDRVWFWQSNTAIEFTVDNVGRDWNLVNRLPLPDHAKASNLVFASGRYIVFAATQFGGLIRGQSVLAWLDTRTLTVSYLPRLMLFGQVQLAIDRWNDRIVALDETGVYAVDPFVHPTRMTTIPLRRGANESRTLAVARGRVFVGTSQNTSPVATLRTTVFDVVTGTVLGTIADRYAGHVSADERFLMFLSDTDVRTDGGHIYDLETWDTQTLALIRHSPQLVRFYEHSQFFFVDNVLVRMWSAAPTPKLEVRVHDPMRGTVFGLSLDEPNPWSSPYDSRQLFHFGLSLDEPNSWCNPYGSRQLFRGGHRSPYLTLFFSCDDDFGCFSYVQAIDPAGPNIVRTLHPRTFGAACQPAILLLSPPDPPTAVRAIVAGQSVKVEWDPPADVADYEITVGLAPGRRDFRLHATNPTSFSVDNVPPGVYYVRVGASNELGASESDELAITVR